MATLRGRHFLSIGDFTYQEINQVLRTAEILKLQQKRGETHDLLRGKTLAMIFEKSSTRTRVSFETGMYQLGGHALFLSSNDLQLGRGETIEDTAKVLSGYVDGIMARTFLHQTVVDLARFGSVPVINGLSDLEHPCQIVGDFLTIIEEKGKLAGLKVAYIGDGNNVANSLLWGAVSMGMHAAIACPEGYEPDKKIMAKAKEAAKKNGVTVEIVADPKKAVRNADVLYTDVWTSMGQEKEKEKRLKAFKGYQINKELLSLANKDAIVLHCLPAHRGEEISAEVMDGPQSRVFQEAENRLHAQKAIMALIM